MNKFSKYIALIKYAITNPSKGILIYQTNRQVRKDEIQHQKMQISEPVTLDEGIKKAIPDTDFSIKEIQKETNIIERHLEEFFNNLKNKEFPSKEKPYPIDYSLDNNSGILLYLLCRILKPETIIETGVAYGRSTSFILQALKENQKGTLYSIDSIFRPWETKKMIGSAIPEDLKKRWKFFFGMSNNELKNICKLVEGVDIFIHDSLHTYENMLYEFEFIWPHIKKNGYLLSDDIKGNNAFYDFCQSKNLNPIIFKQNLDNLFGLIRKN